MSPLFIFFIIAFSSLRETNQADNAKKSPPRKWLETRLHNVSTDALVDAHILNSADIPSCVMQSPQFEVMINHKCLSQNVSSGHLAKRSKGNVRLEEVWFVRPPLLRLSSLRTCIKDSHPDKRTGEDMSAYIAHIRIVNTSHIPDGVLFSILSDVICNFQIPVFTDISVVQNFPLWFSETFKVLNPTHKALGDLESLISIAFYNFDRLLSQHSITTEDPLLPHPEIIYTQRPRVLMSVGSVALLNPQLHASPLILADDPGNPGDHFGGLVFSYLLSHNVVFDLVCEDMKRNNDLGMSLVGSVLCQMMWSGISHWGTGAMTSVCLSEKEAFQGTILAVRGPRTRDQVLLLSGVNPTVISDPGLLAGEIFPRHPPALLALKDRYREVCVIVHGIDLPRFRKDFSYAYTYLFLDHRSTVMSLMWRIQFCRLVVSSSLHGLIFAHTFGIPAAPICLGSLLHGGEWKFRDYLHSVGVHSFSQRLVPDHTSPKLNTTMGWAELAMNFPQPKMPIDTSHFIDLFPSSKVQAGDARGFRGKCQLSVKTHSIDSIVLLAKRSITHAVAERLAHHASHAQRSAPQLKVHWIENEGVFFCVVPESNNAGHSSGHTSSHEGIKVPLLFPQSAIQLVDDAAALSSLSSNNGAVVMSSHREASIYIPFPYVSAAHHLKSINGLKIVYGTEDEANAMLTGGIAASSSALHSHLLVHSFVLVLAAPSTEDASSRLHNAIYFLVSVLHRCVPVVKGYDKSFMDGFTFHHLEQFQNISSASDITVWTTTAADMAAKNRVLLHWKHIFTAVDVENIHKLRAAPR
jgi:pyruvyltransferase